MTPFTNRVDSGPNCCIEMGAIVGFMYCEGAANVSMGSNAVVRAYSIIYADVTVGDDLKTGHHVLIREHTTIGSRVVIGSGTIIDGHVRIGNSVKIESMVYIPTHTHIGSHVFIGPCAVLTNDKYPQRVRDQYEPRGPRIDDNVTIGANATILPGVHIREGAIVAAGSVVTKEVPPWHLAAGVPASTRPLPDRLREPNRAKKW